MLWYRSDFRLFQIPFSRKNKQERPLFSQLLHIEQGHLSILFQILFLYVLLQLECVLPLNYGFRQTHRLTLLHKHHSHKERNDLRFARFFVFYSNHIVNLFVTLFLLYKCILALLIEAQTPVIKVPIQWFLNTRGYLSKNDKNDSRSPSYNKNAVIHCSQWDNPHVAACYKR